MRDLPSGTVTFLFTDVEGSTRLLHELGPEGYAHALGEHRRVLREAFVAHGGVEVDTQGDAFFVAFPTAPGALKAAGQATEALQSGPIRVRMGVHTGTPHLTDEGYVGDDVHRAARIAAAGHGGQVLVSAATASLVGADGLRDLGEHRFKDLSAPERVFQLGEAVFPPLKSLHQTNLPVPATAFLGRERELHELGDLLGRADVRLLTLIGPGGTGKTRLALQAAGEAAESFPAGLWWVPLAPLRDPGLALESAAAALGATDGLAEHIGDKRLLLFFDNFEHVIAAADDLPPLLAACPHLRVLVTSRELLRLPGEQAYPVPPLEPQDGVQLFLARARAADPGFHATAGVAELCDRLEHLPLALELAAARVRLLSPEQLLERLGSRLDVLKAGRGVDPRQQTLRATIEWSHGLLDAEERQLFARLAVFRGGCTLEAAEQVCQADLDLLQSLVDKSLIRVRDDGRFWMLETIREYAIEQMEASGEAAELRRRHAAHFRGLSDEAEPHMRDVALGAGGEGWLDRLEREHDNLRGALAWFEGAGETQAVLRMAGVLAELWHARHHFSEGRRRLEGALASDASRTRARAAALVGAADFAAVTGDIQTSDAHAEEALALYRALGDVRGTADALWRIGAGLYSQDRDLERADRVLRETVALFDQVGDVSALGALRTLAAVHLQRRDHERARALYEEVLHRARAIHNELWEATALGALALVALGQGRVEDAVSLLRQNMPFYRRVGNAFRLTENLCRIACVLVVAGDPGNAVRLIACTDVLFEEMGATQPWVAHQNADTLAAARAKLDETAFADAWNTGRLLTADEAADLALESLEHL